MDHEDRILAHEAHDQDRAHVARHVQRHPRHDEREQHPRERGDRARRRHERRAPVAELEQDDDRDQHEAREQHGKEPPERLLLLLVLPAVGDRHSGRERHLRGDATPDLAHGAPEIASREARRDAHERPEILAVDLGLGRSGRDGGELGQGEQRPGGAGRSDADLAQGAILPEKHPQVVHAVAHQNLTDDRAGDGRLHGRLDGVGREAVAGQRPGIDADPERRAGDDDTVEHVLHSLHARDRPRHLLRLRREQLRVVPENLDVDRLRRAARQVADVVLEQLAEVGANGGLDPLDRVAQVGDHLVHRAAPAERLQLDDVVAAVRLGDGEA